MLFYVSYWLLSKMEAARWNRFVKGKVQEAVAGGSALALPSVAFLAVYREGFETVLFYKALVVSAGTGAQTLMPVLGGIATGALALAAVYIAINRYGVRIPLKPFFGITSAFLLYMAFVFAGKGIASDLIFKVSVGRPHGIDLMVNGELQLLINTPLGKRAQEDDYSLRQAAIANRVPYTTTLSAASAACDAIESMRTRKASVRSLQEWQGDIA